MLKHAKELVARFFRSIEKRKRRFDPRLYLACDIPNKKKRFKSKISFPHPVGIVIARKARIGRRCRIWQNVTIGANDVEGSIANEYPTIANNVDIFSGAAIIGNVSIGEHAIIGANSVVKNDVPAFTIYAGAPAKQVGLNLAALSIYQERYLNAFMSEVNEFSQSEIVKCINESSVCIDCGANTGEITNIFAQKGATVYAFEPNPLCFDELEKRFAHNPSVHIIKKAVLDSDTKIKLYHSPLASADKLFAQSSSIFESKDNVDTTSYDEIDAIDLTRFIKELNTHITVLKLDVEGAEYHILEKLINEDLVDKIGTILVEPHEDSIPEIRDIAYRVRAKIIRKNLKHIHLDWI